MIKKIVCSFASVFLLWQSAEMIKYLPDIKNQHWVLTIFIGWVINMFITGIFAFAGFAFDTQKLLPSAYYFIKNPSRLERIYQFFRVDIFRKILLATLWRSNKQRKSYYDGTIEGLTNLEEQSKKSEFGHLLPFFILVFLAIYASMTGNVSLGISVFVINFVGNFYPVILQRHHRMRIQRIRERVSQ